MVVVADTSPINYFVLIGQIDLLMQLHKRILIPLGVLAELERPRAPNLVREWIVSSPKWLEVRSPKSNLILAQLDLGESEAIGLAAEVHAELVLIDEQAGRQEVVRRGLKVAGTLSGSTRPIRPGLSISMTQSINFGRPASVCPR